MQKRSLKIKAYITPKLAKALEKASLKMGETKSEIIRQALRDFLRLPTSE